MVNKMDYTNGVEIRKKLSDTFDFENAWVEKLSTGLSGRVDDSVKMKILEGSERLSEDTDREDVIDWSIQAMSKLDNLVEDEQTRQDIMTSCSCHYPKEQLQKIKNDYAQTKDLKLAHQKLQEQFLRFLKNDMQLDSDMITEILSKGWGLAGILDGNRIFATKIPKSGFLKDYMAETDPDKKRQLYCHCPRVRDILKSLKKISVTYCYCGAGYYKGIWEEILQKPVKVEVLESIMKGDDVCKIAVHLQPA